MFGKVGRTSKASRAQKPQRVSGRTTLSKTQSFSKVPPRSPSTENNENAKKGAPPKIQVTQQVTPRNVMELSPLMTDPRFEAGRSAVPLISAPKDLEVLKNYKDMSLNYKAMPFYNDYEKIFEGAGVEKSVFENMTEKFADTVDFMAYAFGHKDDGIDSKKFSPEEFKNWGTQVFTELAETLKNLEPGQCATIPMFFPDAYGCAIDKQTREAKQGTGVRHIGSIYINGTGEALSRSLLNEAV